MGDRLGALARVGDGDERVAGPLVHVMMDALEGVLDALPRIGEERIRLDGRAGLAGDDDERPEWIEVVKDRADRLRIGRSRTRRSR